MKSKSNGGVIYLPFSPGIPWKITKKKKINPSIPRAIWDRVFSGKRFVVCAYGGLFEAFFSLSILEAINRIEPGRAIAWGGDYETFGFIVGASGLVSVDDNASRLLVEKYPAPVFLDKGDTAYFNCLYNYIDLSSCYGDFIYRSNKPACEQIFSNSMVPWSLDYIPELRDLDSSLHLLDSWVKPIKFHKNHPYVLIFPDRTGLSNHTTSHLGWSLRDVKALAAVLFQAGIRTVVCSHDTLYARESVLYSCAPGSALMLHLMKNATAVLSEEPDFLLLSMMISNARIISRDVRGALNLEKNRDWLGIPRTIFTGKSLLLTDVLRACTMEIK